MDTNLWSSLGENLRYALMSMGEEKHSCNLRTRIYLPKCGTFSKPALPQARAKMSDLHKSWLCPGQEVSSLTSDLSRRRWSDQCSLLAHWSLRALRGGKAQATPQGGHHFPLYSVYQMWKRFQFWGGRAIMPSLCPVSGHSWSFNKNLRALVSEPWRVRCGGP